VLRGISIFVRAGGGPQRLWKALGKGHELLREDALGPRGVAKPSRAAVSAVLRAEVGRP